ncbi:MAG: CHAT domain-containing protein [Rhizonema sp. NSF051]|nr:CHAT domain-containing protein [Rhizonema sp. NSF051]
MTQEFHISVTPVGQSDYLVRTEKVSPGVPLAEELVTWPVADWLTAAGHLMNDPLKSVLQGDAIARNSVNLVALGQKLYNALFQGTLRDSLITAQGIAQNHQQVLRLRLGLKDTRLARLPWEVMHVGDRPLATGSYIAFSRYQSGVNPPSRLSSSNMTLPATDAGIKVLMAIASPTDLDRLDLLKQEAIRLQAELYRQIPYSEGGYYLPEIQLTVLEQPGREELTQALEQGRYDVLHYSGHSNLGPGGGEIYLVNSRTGLRETLSGDDLAGLLVNNNIQMAVFNSCLGTYAATSDPGADTGEHNLTESLVKRGIKSVLAMSERIPDDVALTLTQLFYRNLSHGLSVDLCASRMRQGLIAAYGSHQVYWALPILYLQPEFDGHLSPESDSSENGELFNEYDSNLGGISSIYSDSVDAVRSPLGEIQASRFGQNSGLDWLGEDTWGDLVNEIEYDDASYAEDSAVVSDLFRQLDNSNARNQQSHMTAELVEDGIEKPQVSDEIDSFDENDAGVWEQIREAASYGKTNMNPHELPVFSQDSSEEATSGDWNSNYASSDPTTQTKRSRRRTRRKLWYVLGTVGVSAIALTIGIQLWQRQMSDIPTIPVDSISNSNHSDVNLKADSTGIVTAYATDKLSRGDLKTGLMAVDELFDRNALNNAKTALDIIPQYQADNPSVNFIKGRLAWQSLQAGDNTYNVDDVRRYWDSAAKAKPDSSSYANALGFAYYAEGDLNRAIDSWFKALNVSLKERSNSVSPTPVATETPLPKEAIMAYAGLALGLYKNAHNQPDNKRERYIGEAIKLRQIVVKQDPESFAPDKLAKNWLWTKKIIEDWQDLLQQKTYSQHSTITN